MLKLKEFFSHIDDDLKMSQAVKFVLENVARDWAFDYHPLINAI